MVREFAPSARPSSLLVGAPKSRPPTDAQVKGLCTTRLTLCSEDFAGARVAELIRRREHSGRTHFPSDRWRRSLVLGTPSALAPMSCGIQPGVHLQPQLTGAVRSSRDAASPRRPSSSTSQGASIPSFALREKPLHTSDRYLAPPVGCGRASLCAQHGLARCAFEYNLNTRVCAVRCPLCKNGVASQQSPSRYRSNVLCGAG